VSLSRRELAKLSPAELTAFEERLEAMVADAEAGKGPWLCNRPGCDGQPHAGRRYRHARASQRWPTQEFDVWLLLAGRGFGKTRTGAEWAIHKAHSMPGSRGALVGPIAGDTRDILVEGESGIMTCARATFRPVYEPSKRRLTYPNGSIQMLYSAEEPDRLRGPQHHYGWFDELASWKRLQHTWDMAQLGMRLGDHPEICITTTPRPLPLIKALLKDPMCRVVRGSTYDNLHNLAPTFRRAVVAKYEGTTLGRQELDAEVLDDLPGALVARAVIDRNRVDVRPAFILRAVSVDPAGTGAGDEAGIIAGGRGADGRDYLTHDASGHMSARDTAITAWKLFYETHADVLVYEDNLGKQWLGETFKSVHRELYPKRDIGAMRAVTATIGKKLRAQPVAMRYEQDRVSHLGALPELEDQLTTWIPEEDPNSPDRIDAAVHLITYMMKRFDLGETSVAAPHSREPRGAAVHPMEAARRRRAAQAREKAS
jgi:phage terminase large subunit-like protein